MCGANAFLEEAEARGISVPPDCIISTTIDVGAAAGLRPAWPQWQRAGVTAVVCGTDTHAYGVLQEARVAGVQIPRSWRSRALTICRIPQPAIPA